MSRIGTDGSARLSVSEPRVDSVDVAAYTVPTDAPEGDGTLAWTSTTLVLVRVRAGGRTGVGWTYGSTGCVPVITDDLAGVVTGRDPLDVTGAFDAMVKSVRNSSRPGLVGYAISAVDVALWDLRRGCWGFHCTGCSARSVSTFRCMEVVVSPPTTTRGSGNSWNCGREVSGYRGEDQDRGVVGQ